MTPDSLAKLTDVFSTIFNIPDIELTDEMTAADVPGWDSFNHVNLIVTIEIEFDVQFATEEISGLKNVGEMIAMLDSKLQEKRAAA